MYRFNQACSACACASPEWHRSFQTGNCLHVSLLSFLLVVFSAAASADPANPPVLIAPGDNASNVAINPLLQVSVSDPNSDALEVTFHGRQVNGPGEDFTLIAMPDTQHYTDGIGEAATFAAQTQWIVTNREALNIVFVTGLGDIVQDGSGVGNDVQWMIADSAYSLLEDPLTTLLSNGIPFGLAVGNHDQSPIGGGDTASTLKYNEYFGEARFSGRPYYGGHYEPAGDTSNNDNHFQLFSAGGMEFIIIHFEYDTSPLQSVLDWADDLLATYPNRRAIVSAHYLVDLGSPTPWGTQGQAIYNELESHENLFLMLAGHRHGEGRRQDTASNGNIVNTLLSDYQDYANGGDGFLRIMTFSPAHQTISVRTYSPTLDQYEVDDSSEFTLSYAMDGLADFQVIGSEFGIASGASSSVNWPGLTWETEYEWFVTTDDGTDGLTTGPVWRFTTEAQPPATVPPETEIVSGPPDPGSLGVASFEFTGSDNLTAPENLSFECSLDNAPFSPCDSPLELLDIDTGPHQFAVRAIDGDNNTDPSPAVYPWLIDPTPTFVVEQRISQSSDDAEESLTDGSMDLDSTDLEMVLDTGATPDKNQAIGMRFASLAIPPAASVVNAYIEFETDETSSGATQLSISVEAEDNPLSFSDTVNQISGRELIDESVAWNPVNWDTSSIKHRTPDLSKLVQELLNRPGWASGNAMVFVVSGSGQRIAESFDGEATNAPLLVVEYAENSLANERFQQGLEDYSGNKDTYLTQAAPDADNSAAETLIVDRSPLRQILLRFEEIVGEGTGQMPVGSLVYSAQLDIQVSNESSQGALLHRMLQDWNDTDSWNEWDNGIDTDDTEARSSSASSSPGSPEGIHSIDVTGDVQAWANGEINFGWALLPPAGDNSWQFDSAEGDDPPLLRVYFQPPQRPGIVINEIMRNPASVDDASGEWIELFNPTEGDVDIDGWSLANTGSDAHLINNGTPLWIPAGGRLVLGRNSNSAQNGGVLMDYAYGSDIALDNDNDEIVLRDGFGAEIDRVDYDDGVSFPNADGASMTLRNPALDNNDGSNWCPSMTPFGDGDLGTPGKQNTCSPELLLDDGFE